MLKIVYFNFNIKTIITKKKIKYPIHIPFYLCDNATLVSISKTITYVSVQLVRVFFIIIRIRVRFHRLVCLFFLKKRNRLVCLSKYK